jgi:hypothetical protein
MHAPVIESVAEAIVGAEDEQVTKPIVTRAAMARSSSRRQPSAIRGAGLCCSDPRDPIRDSGLDDRAL